MDKIVRVVRDSGKQPTDDLPIAPNPAVFAPTVSAHVGRIVIDDFDLRDQARSCIDAF